jgi:hypothetical protein
MKSSLTVVLSDFVVPISMRHQKGDMSNSTRGSYGSRSAHLEAGICSSFTKVPFVESRSITKGLAKQSSIALTSAVEPDPAYGPYVNSLDPGLGISKLALFYDLSILNHCVLF